MWFHTTCLYWVASIPTWFNFLPNVLIDLDLNMSSCFALLIGIVPSGHDSSYKLHNWNLPLKMSVWLLPFGLSRGSYTYNMHKKWSIIKLKYNSLIRFKKYILKFCLIQLAKHTNGFCPFNRGWSKAGCLWDTTQSIILPSGFCKNEHKYKIYKNKHNH